MLENVSRIATVGPRKNTAIANNMAASRLACDSHLMPRSTPLTAEAMKSSVTTRMMPACQAFPIGRPKTLCRPLLICAAPMPSEAATPKAVATTAITLNTGESRRTQGHGRVSVAELISATLPRRK